MVLVHQYRCGVSPAERLTGKGKSVFSKLLGKQGGEEGSVPLQALPSPQLAEPWARLGALPSARTLALEGKFISCPPLGREPPAIQGQTHLLTPIPHQLLPSVCCKLRILRGRLGP